MSLSELQNTYNSTLIEIGTLRQNLANRTTEYVNRVITSNPYFNKNIQFSNNVFAYVTNKGVVKKYASQPTGIGVTFVPLTFPWLPTYDTQGVQIPTTPPLITGTPMNGKSVGYEGENVFVNTIIPNVEATYKGCKVTDSVQFIGGAPTSDVANGSYTYDACKQAAINSNYKYFGIKDMNANGTGFCAVSNDIANIRESRIDIQITLKTLGPKMVGNVAGLNNKGELIITRTNGRINYINNNKSPVYIGCFGINSEIPTAVPSAITTPATALEGFGNDNSSRFGKLQFRFPPSAFKTSPAPPSSSSSSSRFNDQLRFRFPPAPPSSSPSLASPTPAAIANPVSIRNIRSSPIIPKINTKQKCFKAAEQGNFNYYGLQKAFGTTVECVLGNDLNAFKKNKTSKDSCTYTRANSYVGDTTSTAVYTRNPNEINNYFLLLNDNGSVVIYRGSDPSDFENLTTVKEWSFVPINPNPMFTAAKSKFGTNFLMAGQTLAPGDFVGSPNGSIYLLMNISGQLAIHTTENRVGCVQLPNSTWVGGQGAAFYELSGGPGFVDEIGKFGYVDENSLLKIYDPNQEKMTDVYSQLNGLNSSTPDISTFPNVFDASGCKIECNKNKNCVAFVFNATTKNCNLKGADFTSGISASDVAATNLYIRNKEPKSNRPGFSVIPGISDKVNAIDSVQFHNYEMNIDNYNNPLSNANSVQRAALDNATGRANLLSNQLINGTENYSNLNDNITNINKNIDSSKIIHETINTNVNKYNENDKLRQNIKNNDNIVKDSEIVVSQQNYQSVLLTILASGAVLLSMAIVKS